MNRREWKELCKIDKGKAHYWYNKVRMVLKSKEFESSENCDKDAKVIHHLRDTEEQRKYNNEHYEMFGFEIDENGNESFTYGKYVVFWTKEHHSEYHSQSDETNAKRSASLKMAYKNPELREKCSKSHKGIKCKEETKLKISAANKGKQYFGDKNPFYGKQHTEESRKKMSESHKGMLVGESHPFYGKHHTEESRKKMSDALKGKPSAFKGKHHSEESIAANKQKNIVLKLAVREAYDNYKNNGGTLKWNAFQKMIKNEVLKFDSYELVNELSEEYIPEIEDDYIYLK